MSEKDPVDTPLAMGPWQRKSREWVYQNPWISVAHDEVITPAGTDGIYGVVHFKSQAIGIVAVDAEHNTWLVGQHRYALDEYSWEIPMGGGPLGADPLLTAQQELQQETGLYGGQWERLFRLHTSNSVTDEQGYVFMASDLKQGPQQLEASESDLVVKKLPVSAALDMIKGGDITDVISIAALLAVARRLNPG